MAAVFFTSIAAFISTNLDDIFMLTLFFAQAKSRKGALKVVAGQYIGMGCLAAPVFRRSTRKIPTFPSFYLLHSFP